jgi:hypothetical protein
MSLPVTTPKMTYSPPPPKAQVVQALPVQVFAVELRGTSGKMEQYLAIKMGDTFYAFPGGQQFMAGFASFTDDTQIALRRMTSSGQDGADATGIPSRDAVKVL